MFGREGGACDGGPEYSALSLLYYSAIYLPCQSSSLIS